jgi:hypothetical protein
VENLAVAVQFGVIWRVVRSWQIPLLLLRQLNLNCQLALDPDGTIMKMEAFGSVSHY